MVGRCRKGQRRSRTHLWKEKKIQNMCFISIVAHYKGDISWWQINCSQHTHEQNSCPVTPLSFPFLLHTFLLLTFSHSDAVSIIAVTLHCRFPESMTHENVTTFHLTSVLYLENLPPAVRHMGWYESIKRNIVKLNRIKMGWIQTDEQFISSLRSWVCVFCNTVPFMVSFHIPCGLLLRCIRVHLCLAMSTYASACVCLLVCIQDMWGGIHGDGLALELMWSPACEMRTKGEGTVVSGSKQTHLDVFWLFDGQPTHTHTHSSYQILPLFFFPLWSLGTKQIWQTIQRVCLQCKTCLARSWIKEDHRWGEHTENKNKQAQLMPLGGRVQQRATAV